MHFSLLISAVFGNELTHTSFLVALVVLACVFGAEVAGICILIRKLVRARRERYAQMEEENGSSYRHYSVGLILALGAIPKATYAALSVLAVLTAVGALVFLVLLIVIRACGYDYISHSKRRALAQQPAQEPAPAEEPAPYEEPVYADEVDGQAQDGYTDPTEAQITEIFESFEEEPDTAEEPVEEEPIEEEPVEELAEEEAEESVECVAPVVVEPAVQSATVTTVETEPAFADGTRPYKVVEKVVTETFKEVYTETPQPTQNTSNAATDAVLEKLTDVLDALNKRNELDLAEKEKQEEEKEKEKDEKNDQNGSVAVSASVDEEEDLDDEEDTDDADEDEDEKKGEDDEDRDGEENDTDGDHFTGNERIIGFDEETGCYIVAHYRKSFEAKLIQARPNIKKYYSELKNALLSYKGTKDRISWSADSFHNGRTPIAKINVKTRILELYLALDPASLEGTVYRGKDVGDKKKYADTPFRYKLRTPRKFKWAMELVQRVCEENGLSPIDIEHVDYEQLYPFDTTENLVERKLIKEYIRQEKPASSFELDPDHVPELPEEDDSVIPANANFSWEFDNDKLVEKEPEPIPEPEPEPEPEPQPQPEPAPEPVPAPAPEPAPAPAASVKRETVKITEMRYTERYYADSKPTYEHTLTTTEPIEAEAIPVGADVEEPVFTEPAPAQEESVEEIVLQPSRPAEEEAEAEPVKEQFDIWGDFVSSKPDPEEEYDSYAEEEAEEEDTDAYVEESDGEEAEELFFSDETAEEGTEETEEEAWEEADEEPEVIELQAEPEEGEYETETEEETEAVEEEVEEEAEEEQMEEMPAPAPRPAVNPAVALVDICSLESEFPANAIITLDALKAKGLVLPSATTLKIYASGALSKPYTVEANHFTLDAIKAISDAEGDSVMVR